MPAATMGSKAPHGRCAELGTRAYTPSPAASVCYPLCGRQPTRDGLRVGCAVFASSHRRQRRKCTFSGVQNCITQPSRAGRLQLLGFMMVGSCAASFILRHQPCTARCCARVCQTALWSLGMVYPCRLWQLTLSTLKGSTFNFKGALSRSQEFDLGTFSPL